MHMNVVTHRLLLLTNHLEPFLWREAALQVEVEVVSDDFIIDRERDKGKQALQAPSSFPDRSRVKVSRILDRAREGQKHTLLLVCNDEVPIYPPPPPRLDDYY